MSTQIDTTVADIKRQTDWLADVQRDSQRRYENAAAAGAKLAAEVYRFIQDPEAVGTEALEAAYGEFMGQHAANFTDSAREAVEARA